MVVSLAIIMINKYIKDWNLIIVALLAVMFFVATSFYIHQVNSDGLVKWMSPDENANYFFARLFASENSLIAFDGVNKEVEDIVRPRSFRSDDGELKPVSFLGIILIYGMIGKIFGIEIIAYITPFVAALGIFLYYLFVRRIFNRKVAMISSVMLSFFPVYIYYSVRSMFHNVLFLVFLMAGMYFLACLKSENGGRLEFRAVMRDFFRKDDKAIENLAISAFAGLFIGLALLVRTSELLWVGPMLVFLWVLNFRHIKLSWVVVILVFVIIGYSPAFYYNYFLYGSMWQGGYHEMNQSIVDVTSVGTKLFEGGIFSKEMLERSMDIVKTNIFYFGFRSLQSWQQFINYFMVMFFWIFWPAVFGLSYIIENWKERPRIERQFIIVSAWVLVFLMFYYGSWKFNDNPDITKITIGNSYTRYWLPIYLSAFPLVSMFLLRLSKMIVLNRHRSYVDLQVQPRLIYENKFVSSFGDVERSDELNFVSKIRVYKKKLLEQSRSSMKLLRWGVLVCFIGILSFMSVQYVLIGSEEGLIESFYKQKIAKEEILDVYSLTSKDSVIITRYHDKVLFPERRVIVGLFNDDNMIRNYRKLALIGPLYYFNFTLPANDINYLNNRRLKESRLVLVKIREINAFSLYEVRAW